MGVVRCSPQPNPLGPRGTMEPAGVGGRADADVAPPAVPLREWLSQFDALGAESIMRAQGYTTVKTLRPKAIAAFEYSHTPLGFHTCTLVRVEG
eukprot:SAG25_NODE_242_length_11160_cov_254.065546_5_plen_94_part_00